MARRRSRGLLTTSRRKAAPARALVTEILNPATGDDGFGYNRDLKRDARTQARALGHELAPFRERAYTKLIYNANCGRCQALVCVNTAPRPGEPHIYGAGVTQRCP